MEGGRAEGAGPLAGPGAAHWPAAPWPPPKQTRARPRAPPAPPPPPTAPRPPTLLSPSRPLPPPRGANIVRPSARMHAEQGARLEEGRASPAGGAGASDAGPLTRACARGR